MSEKNSNGGVEHHHGPTWLAVLLGNFRKPQFIVGGLIPAAIMIILNQFDMFLEGALISSVWAIGVFIFEYIFKKSYNLIAIISAIFAVIQFTVTIVTKNVDVFLITTVFEDLIFAAVAFITLLFGRPLVQIIVEAVALEKFSESFRKTKEYRKAWVMLTLLVGLKNILDAGIKALVLNLGDENAYLAFRPIYNNISGAFMIFLYFWYPSYYWGKLRSKKKD